MAATLLALYSRGKRPSMSDTHHAQEFKMRQPVDCAQAFSPHSVFTSQKRSPSAQDFPSIHCSCKARHSSGTQGFSEPQSHAKVCWSSSEATQRGSAGQGKFTIHWTLHTCFLLEMFFLTTACHPQRESSYVSSVFFCRTSRICC